MGRKSNEINEIIERNNIEEDIETTEDDLYFENELDHDFYCYEIGEEFI